MPPLERLASMLDHAAVYRLWQSPFARAKLEPVFRHNDMRTVRRVLDVGCGPGTNTPFFREADYLGIELNERYVRDARERHGREFVVADAREYQPPEGHEFDFILLNSFLHHIDDENTGRILHRLHGALADGGHIHILDLELPERVSVARWLARNDRGDHPRPLERWRELFGEVFDTVVFEPFTLRMCGVGLWQMVYFKGQARKA